MNITVISLTHNHPFQVHLRSLNLDTHARDKLLRLVGDRYDPATDCLTLVADRCPLSQQNRDYCHYLLTVLYNEALVRELHLFSHSWGNMCVYVCMDGIVYMEVCLSLTISRGGDAGFLIVRIVNSVCLMFYKSFFVRHLFYTMHRIN